MKIMQSKTGDKRLKTVREKSYWRNDNTKSATVKYWFSTESFFVTLRIIT